MPYNKKQKIDFTFYIQQGDTKQVLTCVTDPAPTIFETVDEVEVRFNVELTNKEEFYQYHALDKYQDDVITVGFIYENGIELKTTFTVLLYERRFGSSKGSIVTHVFKGAKQNG